MTLDWVRRHDPHFDAPLRRLLFRPEGSIVHAEEDEPDVGRRVAQGSVAGASTMTPADRGLGIGSLRARRTQGGADVAGDAGGGDAGGSDR
jgi:hypothetical protein